MRNRLLSKIVVPFFYTHTKQMTTEVSKQEWNEEAAEAFISLSDVVKELSKQVNDIRDISVIFVDFHVMKSGLLMIKPIGITINKKYNFPCFKWVTTNIKPSAFNYKSGEFGMQTLYRGKFWRVHIFARIGKDGLKYWSRECCKHRVEDKYLVYKFLHPECL